MTFIENIHTKLYAISLVSNKMSGMDFLKRCHFDGSHIMVYKIIIKELPAYRRPSTQMDNIIHCLTTYPYQNESRLRFIIGLITYALISSVSQAAQIVNGGPNDYYDSAPWMQQYVHSVNKHHLFPAEEQVIKGYTTSSTGAKFRYIWEEIDFTLRWFPNHPRGLQFMGRWLPKFPNPAPEKNADYYFMKAIEYRPSPQLRSVDATARLLYAIYLHRKKSYPEAQKQYESALAIAPDNSETHYNFGLLLVAIKDYSAALEHAKAAYSLNYPLSGLKNKLKKVGVWKDIPQGKNEEKKTLINTQPH